MSSELQSLVSSAYLAVDLVFNTITEPYLPHLRMLERNGLVDRKVHPTVPPRVEYTLTEPGRALRTAVDAICGWTHQYLGHIESARGRFDA
ncbi:winged helix-turn-helix transcriptional regulator [Streptomyces achromogenes]|uniref:winged helix-turn-helix transcriptional regulator n=1 Tax=Streptomyces achromogenes TaxID=67255 RepID=UPI0036FA4D92